MRIERKLILSDPQRYILESPQKINLFMGGTGCFSGDQLIITSEGSKQIRDIELGDIKLIEEDSLLTLQTGNIVNLTPDGNITLETDDLDITAGADTIIGSGELTIYATHNPWNYRLGTAGENAEETGE